MTEGQKPLTEMFHEWVAATIDPEGFPIPHGLCLNAQGELAVVALALEPDLAYSVMLKLWGEPATEMIFALDRYTLPDQHTEFADVLAGFHFTRGAPPRPFIIEYQYEPRIVKPIDWTNLFWTGALYSEINQVLRARLGLAPGQMPN
jgi:hypothetical protein